MARYCDMATKSPIVCNIEAFLRALSIVTADDHMRGITWIELRILYRHMGHPKVISDPDCVARSRVTLDKQIRAFKTQVGRVADRIPIGSDDRDLFKPYLHHKQNLAGTAILGIHPSLRFNVCGSKMLAS